MERSQMTFSWFCIVRTSFARITMSEATCKFTSQSKRSPESSLQKCISVLRAAKNDTERFAALLLVTQLVHSNEIDGLGRRQLFDAIGFKFINRLLNTRNVPSDCPAEVYHSLALTILACFSSDEELRVHPEMIKKIPLFLDGISNSAETGVSDASVEDCFQIIASFACSSTGCRRLVENGAFSALSRIVSENEAEKYTKKARETLLRILNNDPHVFWQEQREVLVETLNGLSQRLSETQDNTKFELCNYLVLFLSGAEKSVFQGGEKRWLADVYKGLNDILQSKISSEQRNPAIILLSAVIELVGMDWMIEFSRQQSPGLYILSLTIVSVEIRMILDGKTAAEIVNKTNLLCSCFNILEKAINFAIVNAGLSPNNRKLPAIVLDGLPKVYSLATESIHSIVTFLDRVPQMGTTTGQERHVVFASVRVLCAWMAEETAALQEDICRLLPFLLKLGKESLNASKEHLLDGGDKTEISQSTCAAVSVTTANDVMGERLRDEFDIMRFLLPPLCHLSADEKTRKILIQNEGLLLLSEYFFHQWKIWYQHMNYDMGLDEMEMCIVTLLGIFLNIVVTEPKLVTSDQTFKEIGQHAITSVSQLLSSEGNVVILLNLVVLGLMLIRNHTECSSVALDCAQLPVFLKDSMYVLKEAKCLNCNGDLPPNYEKTQLAVRCEEAWADILELWLIGMQVFSALASSLPLTRELLKESGWMETISGFLNSTGQAEELSADEKGALVDVLRKVSDL